MARIRTIKPEFWTSDQITDCSTTARLLFIGMWNFCDDAGRHVASIKRLKMEVFPADSINFDEIRSLVDELIAAGLIIEYQASHNSQPVVLWQVTGWHHQKVERKTIKYPASNSTTDRRGIVEESSNDRRTIVDHSPPEGSLRETKGREGICPLSGADPTPPKEDPPKPKRKTRRKSKFKPPTEQEVAEYCSERGNGIEASKFLAHYEACGWVYGPSQKPVKDWRACVRTWECRDREDADKRLKEQQNQDRSHDGYGRISYGRNGGAA